MNCQLASLNVFTKFFYYDSMKLYRIDFNSFSTKMQWFQAWLVDFLLKRIIFSIKFLQLVNSRIKFKVWIEGKLDYFFFFYLIAYFSQINWVEQMHHNFMVREKTIFVNSDFQWWTKYFCALKTKVIMKALLQNYEVINAM